MSHPIRARSRGVTLAACIVTILAITGTLSSCGRYGSPVRVAPTVSEIEAPVSPSEDPDEEDEAAGRPSESK